MAKKIKIGFLFGGLQNMKVLLSLAKNIVNSLIRPSMKVLIGIDKNGKWHLDVVKFLFPEKKQKSYLLRVEREVN